MRFVFGPVPSRRLGSSLGVDPTPSLPLSGGNQSGPGEGLIGAKVCNWNCAYCQLGRTRSFTRSRLGLFPPEELLAELKETSAREDFASIDWLTFVGSGEPTLNRDLGLFIHEAKRLFSLPVAVITNGSLLGDDDVAESLLEADAVMPSLDAGDPILFKRINRPEPGLTLGAHVEGIAGFRSRYGGKLWIEVMLIKDVNDGEQALHGIADALARIRPDAVHLLLPMRPPAETCVEAADNEGVQRAKRILGSDFPVLLPDFRRGSFTTDAKEGIGEAIAEILARHPMSETELLATLRERGVADAEAALDFLVSSSRITRISRGANSYYRLSLSGKALQATR